MNSHTKERQLFSKECLLSIALCYSLMYKVL